MFFHRISSLFTMSVVPCAGYPPFHAGIMKFNNAVTRLSHLALHIEKFVFPTFFSHRLRPSRMVQFVCACFIEVNMISLTQSIRIREGILKTPAKGKPYAFHMIVSRIRKKVSRLSHRSLRDMDRHKYGRYTEAEEHNRSASADKSCVELLEEPGFAAMPDNRRE